MLDRRTRVTLQHTTTFSSLSLGAMESLARRLALLLGSGDVVTLKGEVGAGKTTFARALIHALMAKQVEVTSPTFTLMQSYDVQLANGTPELLWHIDLYRLKHAEEARALGLKEIWKHIVLIEWPEIIEPILPEGHLNISFDFNNTPESRTLMLHGNDAWRSKLETLG